LFTKKRQFAVVRWRELTRRSLTVMHKTLTGELLLCTLPCVFGCRGCIKAPLQSLMSREMARSQSVARARVARCHESIELSTKKHFKDVAKVPVELHKARVVLDVHFVRTGRDGSGSRPPLTVGPSLSKFPQSQILTAFFSR